MLTKVNSKPYFESELPKEIKFKISQSGDNYAAVDGGEQTNFNETFSLPIPAFKDNDSEDTVSVITSDKFLSVKDNQFWFRAKFLQSKTTYIYLEDQRGAKQTYKISIDVTSSDVDNKN